MSTRRTLRIARSIKEVVSKALTQELTDPRVGFVTVTEVDVSPDMRNATVRISVLGDQVDANKSLHAVQSARGRLQHEVATSLTSKIVPRLSFELDERVKKSVEFSRLLNLARSEYRDLDTGDPPQESPAPEPPEDAEPGDPSEENDQ